MIAHHRERARRARGSQMRPALARQECGGRLSRGPQRQRSRPAEGRERGPTTQAQQCTRRPMKGRLQKQTREPKKRTQARRMHLEKSCHPQFKTTIWPNFYPSVPCSPGKLSRPPAMKFAPSVLLPTVSFKRLFTLRSVGGAAPKSSQPSPGPRHARLSRDHLRFAQPPAFHARNSRTSSFVAKSEA